MSSQGISLYSTPQGWPREDIERKKAHTKNPAMITLHVGLPGLGEVSFCLSHLIHGRLLWQPELTRADLEAQSDSGRKQRQKYITVMMCVPAGSRPKANHIWLSLFL